MYSPLLSVMRNSFDHQNCSGYKRAWFVEIYGCIIASDVDGIVAGKCEDDVRVGQETKTCSKINECQKYDKKNICMLQNSI